MESPCHDPEDVPGQRPRDGGSPAAQSELRREEVQSNPYGIFSYGKERHRDPQRRCSELHFELGVGVT